MFSNCGVATTEIYRALARRGHEIRLFTFHDPLLEQTHEEGQLDPLNPCFLPLNLKWTPYRLGRVLHGELEAFRPDIWHAHIAIPYGLGAMFSRRRPYLLTTHGSDVYYRAWISKSRRLRLLPPGLGPLAFRLAHAALATSVDRVVVYSPDMLEWLPRLGYPPRKLAPCFLGIDTSRFKPPRSSPPAHEGLRVICTRHFEPVYDHPTLLKAVSRVRQRGVPIRLSLVGGGESRPTLERMTSDLGLDDIVEFLGVVPHERLPTILAGSDVLVSTATSDTTALSVLEGMACGLPVVVTRVGSLARRIVNGKNGFLIDPGDVDGLAASLMELAGNTSLRKQMGSENARYVQSEFDMTQTVDRLELIYREARDEHPLV